MIPNPDHQISSAAQVRRLIRNYPFVTLVSNTSHGLIASHYPVLVEGESDPITLLGHVGRPDEQLHELGDHELIVIAMGANGYVSPSWYPDRSVPAQSTWNFTAVHLYGRPELLDAAENYRVLGQLVDYFENRVSCPRRMEGSAIDAAYARHIHNRTQGYRLRASRIETKAKLGQDMPLEMFNGALAGLEANGPFANSELARAMRAMYQSRKIGL